MTGHKLQQVVRRVWNEMKYENNDKKPLDQ